MSAPELLADASANRDKMTLAPGADARDSERSVERWAELEARVEHLASMVNEANDRLEWLENHLIHEALAVLTHARAEAGLEAKPDVES